MQPKESGFAPGFISLTKNDIDLYISGEIETQWAFRDKSETLHRTDDDQYSQFVFKSCFDFFSQYGRQKYGKSAVDGLFRLTNYGYWQKEYRYTPLNSSSYYPLFSSTYLEEAWLNVHLGTFVGWLDRHPISVKAGYFPYQLGRGISFGDAPMNIDYLGWGGGGSEDTRYNHPGILLHGHIRDNITYDFYYTKQSEVSSSSSETRAAVWTARTDGRPTKRGVSKDRDLWAAKMELSHSSKKWGELDVEPYMYYMDSPENYVEFSSYADSSARLGTVGMMVDYKYKRWTLNFELAGQFGHQTMYPIDRDDTALAYSAGDAGSYHTHIFSTGPYSQTVALASATPSTSEGVQYNGAISYDSAYNSDYFGNARFRDGYRIDYRGYMGIVDLSYDFDNYPVRVSGAAGYISGDHYPYNDELDKRYRAFIPYGDHNYLGHDVKSYVIMYLRRVPRPTDISYRLANAQNNFDDISNLQYLGLGTEYKPLRNDRMLLTTNVMWFWEACPPKQWDVNASVYSPYNTQHVISGDQSAGYVGGWSYGWETEQDASKFLGTEINATLEYLPVERLLVKCIGGIFFPGSLYKDVEGMPNTKDNNYTGLGHDPVLYLNLGVEYKF